MLSDNTQEIAQNKLLLLYIIKFAPKSFSNEELSEFILYKSYMNYFTIQQYLSELIEGDFISVDSNQKYKLLNKGEITLDYFKSKISNSILEDLSKEFKIQQLTAKKEAQVIAEFFQKENEQYTVNLKLVENEDTLFSLYFEVPSAEQAEIICKAWKENTERIYQGVINMLI